MYGDFQNHLQSTINEIKDAGLSNLIERFNEMDDDHSGEIDPKEFRHLARQLIPSVSDAFLEELFADVDKDNDGFISFTEYCSYCMPRLRTAELSEATRLQHEADEARSRELQQIQDQDKMTGDDSSDDDDAATVSALGNACH